MYFIKWVVVKPMNDKFNKAEFYFSSTKMDKPKYFTSPTSSNSGVSN